jgi:putative PIN family toxin of toxin-antitoxin system
MKVLIDTNVLLSAALRDRLPEQVVLFIASHDDWNWLVTAEIQREYIDVLKRPEFRLPPEVIQHWMESICSRTVVVSSGDLTIEFPRDPKDVPFLAAAILNHADYLVTGDADLLHLKTVESTRILSVADFAELFQIT